MYKNKVKELEDGTVLELVCSAVQETMRYRKYKLPEELFEDEEPVVMFSGKHIYVLKGEEAEKVKRIVVCW